MFCIIPTSNSASRLLLQYVLGVCTYYVEFCMYISWMPQGLKILGWGRFITWGQTFGEGTKNKGGAKIWGRTPPLPPLTIMPVKECYDLGMYLVRYALKQN